MLLWQEAEGRRGVIDVGQDRMAVDVKVSDIGWGQIERLNFFSPQS
jgi:hypothetical protein